MPTSSVELEEAAYLKEQVGALLDRAAQELVGEWEYDKLFIELNKRLYESRLNCAWRANQENPVYNPELGTITKSIGSRTVTVSIGLSKDRFDGPCAAIDIVEPSNIVP